MPSRMRVIKTQRFQPGTYYIGDPCYPFPDQKEELWGEWCNLLWQDRMFFDFHGHAVGTDQTAYGDGTYDGLAVDSGTLGILPMALIDQINPGLNPAELDRLACIVTFEQPFTVTMGQGKFQFGHIAIDTDPPYEDEDDEEDHDEEIYDAEAENEA